MNPQDKIATLLSVLHGGKADPNWSEGDWKVPFVDFASQYAEERDAILATVDKVFSDGVFVGMTRIEEFERQAANGAGTRFAIGVSSGTDALFLALKVLGIGPGDEVITPPNSHFSSASAIVHAGATPVFADVLDDQNIDPVAIEAAITPRTKAIMPVHLTGRIAAMDAIGKLAQANGIDVLEDAAQAFGAKYHDRPAGSFGRIAAFSAHPLKVLNAAGDAGYLTTDHADLAARLKRIRNNGLEDRETVSEWGYAARLDVFQAELLVLRMQSLDDTIRRRRANAELYQEQLNGGLVTVPASVPGEYNIFQNFVIQADNRDGLREHLLENGVRTYIHYPIPIHLQPAAKDLGYARGSMPRAERQAERILSLPVHPYLQPWQIEFVCKLINRFYSGTGA